MRTLMPKPRLLAPLSVALLTLLAAGCGRQGTAPGTPRDKANKPVVQVAPVTVGRIASVYRTTGTVSAATEADVAAKVEQRIVALPYREGDAVRGGAVVARLDDTEARQQVMIAESEVSLARAQLQDVLAGARREEIEQARAAYVQAQATERKAEQALRHARELYGAEGLPTQSIDAAWGKLKVARAQLEAATAAWNNANQTYQHVKDQYELDAEPRLRVQEAQGRYKTAEAQVTAAQATLEDARRDLDRVERMQAIGGAAQESLDKARTRLDTAQSQLTAATAARDAAKEGLDGAQEIYSLAAGPKQQLDDARTKLQAGEAQLKAAQEAADAAERDYQHVLKLNSGPLPQREIDEATSGLAETRAAAEAARQKLAMLEAGPTPTQMLVAQERVSQAGAKLAAARMLLSYCLVTAPVSGTVIRRMQDVGDMASPRMPFLTIATRGHPVVKGAIPDRYARQLQVGLAVKIAPTATGNGTSLAGAVTRIYRAADPKTRLMPFEAALPEGFALPVGAMVRLEVTLEEAVGVPVVPSEVLLSRPGGKRVAFVVEDGKAVEKPVGVGIEADGRAEITSGLKPGQLLVVAGYQTVKDKMEVKVAKPGQQPTGKGEPGGQVSPGTVGPAGSARPPARGPQ